MRRVSSRQRLVSWDAFDATADTGSRNCNELSFPGCDNGVDEESHFPGNETTQSQSFHSSTVLGVLSEGNAEIHNNNVLDQDTKLWSRRRKRDRKSIKNVENPKTSPSITSTTTGIPTIVPSYYWETGKLALSKMVHFNDLIDDVHIGIFSFLDLNSLRSVMSINHHYRKLMASNDARSSLWMDHCERIWLIERKEQDQRPIKFVDNFRLPMAATSTATTTVGSEAMDESSDTTNLSLLLSLAPINFPTSVVKPRTRLSRAIRQTIPRYRREEEDQLMRCYEDSLTGRSIVQYTGHVGQGDRCIRSNYPLPRPSRPTYASRGTSEYFSRSNETTSDSALFDCNQDSESHRPFLLNILRCSSKSMVQGDSKSIKASSTSSTLQPSSEWTPFVAPFVDQSVDSIATTINVTPRFISYYEVSILKLQDCNNNDDIMSLDTVTPTPRRSPSHRTSYFDCVAVGVATKAFQFDSRMPGWDQQSYGYHGDDGGIFHSSGGMLKQFGPKYGPGDTVGCGIDYISKGIFYTLNGEFLGYAWERISDDILQKDLFPAVGIDTNSPIHLNFGSADSEAFQFDLSNFIKKHEQIISSLYSLDGSCCSGTTNATATNASSEASAKKSGSSFSRLTTSRRQRKGLVERRNHRDR